MRYRLCGVLAALLLAASGVRASPGDERIIAARDAFRSGDRARLARIANAPAGHDLDPYVEYWRLASRLPDAASVDIEAFLQRYADTYPAEKLRGEWLRQLARNRQWADFMREFRQLVQPDQELTCYAWTARIASGDGAALQEAQPLWLVLLDPPAACAPVLDALIAEGQIGADDIWERLRRQLEARRVTAARATAAYLRPGEAPERGALEAIAADPQRYLKRLKPNFAATRAGRELAMYALQRLARSDPQQAARALEPIKPRLSGAERAYVYGQLGWQGALRHMPEALAWYKAADDIPMSDEQRAWKVRAALRKPDWRMVHAAISSMPAQLAADPAWVYWLGRAHQALGRMAEARAGFERVAGQPTFYGLLADEELGRPISLPPRPTPLAEEELKRVAAEPGVKRTLALIRLDMRVEGVREWNYTLRNRDDRFLLAAAEVAQREGIFDRAISAADRTVAEHDFNLRYLAPFRERVEPRARALDLDQAWVYGLMRQESRFVMNAKSSAGAQGLMQVMPATARWVANKTGMKNFNPARMNDMDTNVALGTSYLKMVLQDLDNHPVLASAAYNAGPGRARRWRAEKPLEGAIYVETIPLAETRDYVKKVMANSVFYSTVLNGGGMPLKARLGVVSPRAGEVGDSEELPEQ